jgi:hypothetical protein
MANKRKKVKTKKVTGSKAGHYNLDIKDKLSETKLKQWIVKAVEMLKDNYPASFIRQHIALNKQGVVNDVVITRILTAANAEISNEYFNKQSEVTAVHLKRYSKQIKKLLAVEELDRIKLIQQKKVELVMKIG